MGYGIKLKELIEEKNLSVRQVANESGIAPTTLYSIISRDTNIRYDYALRIANILDVPVSELCNDIPPSQKDEVEPGLWPVRHGRIAELLLWKPCGERPNNLDAGISAAPEMSIMKDS